VGSEQERFTMQLTVAALDGSPSSRGGRNTIVIVEDDEDLRCLCSEILKGAGFDVFPCADVASAMSTLIAGVPSLILLDRELADGDGLEIARWVRTRAIYADVRIVVFSGRKSSEDVEAAFIAGCDGFLGKPATPPALLAKIRSALCDGDVPPSSQTYVVDSMTRAGDALVEP
jgi:DNA-binding response OmpR family regulator